MNSRKLFAIVRKELIHYFASPMGYIVAAMFSLVTGFFFWLIVVGSRQANVSPVFQNTMIIFLFITPIITMRLWSEEEKTGTVELLRTSPLSLWEIVIGKFLGACVFFLLILSSTLLYLVIIAATGNPDWGIVLSNFLGYILAAMAFFSIGLLASTLSENQNVSAVITFVVLLMLWVVGAASQNVGGNFGIFLENLSVFKHCEDFFKGVIDLTHVFYFLSVIFLGLFFSVKVLESKRS